MAGTFTQPGVDYKLEGGKFVPVWLQPMHSSRVH